MSPARIIAAFLVAPLMTPLVLLGADQLQGAPFNLREQLSAFVFVAGFAYAATIVFGIPVFFLFRVTHWTSVLLYVLVGGLVGLLVSVILNERPSLDVLDLGFRGRCVLAGALSSLVFRMISGARVNQETRSLVQGET